MTGVARLTTAYLLWFLVSLARASPPTNPMRVTSFVLGFMVQQSKATEANEEGAVLKNVKRPPERNAEPKPQKGD
jgi:hypothetical protein